MWSCHYTLGQAGVFLPVHPYIFYSSCLWATPYSEGQSSPTTCLSPTPPHPPPPPPPLPPPPPTPTTLCLAIRWECARNLTPIPNPTQLLIRQVPRLQENQTMVYSLVTIATSPLDITDRYIYIYIYTYLYYKVGSMYVRLSTYPRFTLEWLKLNPQTHIYLESVSPGECLKYVYMATPLSIFKKNQKWYFFQKKIMELQA